MLQRKLLKGFSSFLFDELGLQSTLTEIGIDETHFKAMATNACKGKELSGFKTLNAQDIENIYRMCL